MRESIISIITVAYNCASDIEKTIKSIINQTYTNIEYIIIDGGSTDGTVDIIKKYTDKITFWISEPDNGIYDAMNKGIGRANGKWINFMNAGDSFFNDNVLSDIFEENISDKVSVIYGDTLQCFSYGRFITKAEELPLLKTHMVFCHQSSFVLLSLLKTYLFDTTYKLCADYNLFYKLYRNGYQFYYKPICIAIYDAEEGISSINRLKVLKEESRINNIPRIGYYKFFLKNRIRACILLILPKKISNKILINWLLNKKHYIPNE